MSQLDESRGDISKGDEGVRNEEGIEEDWRQRRRIEDATSISGS
jgi:hypothetical protein